MATQRLTIASFAGKSASVVEKLVVAWRSNPNPSAIERFCCSLRERGSDLPIVYFGEWFDHWSTGILVPGPNALDADCLALALFSRVEAHTWADRCGDQFPEQEWFAARLREASAVWTGKEHLAIVVVREVMGVSWGDEEVEASLAVVPDWLSALANHKER